ncbi:MAG: hypothetical protein HC866_25040 [Leptolyngbyaceae cyanobacterium RU_5_1]|nr:hypothetical protein [Leptolyngbyaceae cyanobacterium RU_5_1]
MQVKLGLLGCYPADLQVKSGIRVLSIILTDNTLNTGVIQQAKLGCNLRWETS